MRISKFSRLGEPSEAEIRMASLTPDAIRAFNRKVQARTIMAAAMRKDREEVLARLNTAPPRLGARPAAIEAAPALPTVATAMIEEPSKTVDPSANAFNLVLANPEQANAHSPSGDLPVPAARPKLKPAVQKELAYAPVQNPDLEDGLPQFSHPVGSRTAIYDISAGVVYMPGGERLEAHSGIGKMRDNPKFAHVRMKGPTPPGTYKVTMREKRFHGVEAVRLTPINGINPHGRDGLLAHSYLLRKRGDSHGCVAFEDYPRFLKAFKRGHIERMIIVPSMPRSKSQIASLLSRGA